MKRIKTIRLTLALGTAVFAASLIGLGCFSASSQTSSKHYAAMDDLQPYVEPYSHAYINLSGTAVPTRLVATKSDGSLRFQFFSLTPGADDVALDEEIYSFDKSHFRYVGNPNEKFEPALPLLEFPLTVGESWDWSGNYVFGGIDRKASANLTSSQDLLNTVAGEFACVKVVVDLEVETGSKNVHEHKLTFWFAPRKGIVRREIELSTTREPMPPKDSLRQP